MSQKRILMLGGSRYVIPAIEAEHNEGYYVITCDYLPDNLAHKYVDEYHNMNIVGMVAVSRGIYTTYHLFSPIFIASHKRSSA